MYGTNWRLWALGVLIAAALGCGKADYEAAMQEQMHKLAFSSNFLDNLQPNATSVIRGVASLRLPAFIDGDAKSTERLPFVPIPGYRFSYEQFIDLGGRDNTQPVYCYFGSVPVAEKKEAAVLAEIKQGVAAKFKGAAWQDVSFDTPDGGKLAFKKMSVSGKQSFPLDANGRDVQQFPGQIDIYVHSTPDYHIIVAFRATEEAAANTGVFQKAPFALGTLVVEAAGPAGEDTREG